MCKNVKKSGNTNICETSKSSYKTELKVIFWGKKNTEHT